jgi:hypothetical protein
MNEILANTCAKYHMVDGASVFIYDLCCRQIEIVAKCIEVIKDDSGLPLEYKYEIIDYKLI